MSETVLIGKLANKNSRRDAVHVAIAPCIALERMKPGQRVCLNDDQHSISACSVGEGVGIVDPYLTEDVHPGEVCYVFLYPNTITGLRHLWHHPAFDRKLPIKKEEGPNG